MSDKDDDMHDRVLEMADRLGLKGNDRRKYVHDHMTRAGYRMEPTYVPGGDDSDDDDDGPDDPFFSRRKSNRDNRRASERPRRPRRDDDSWYS